MLLNSLETILRMDFALLKNMSYSKGASALFLGCGISVITQAGANHVMTEFLQDFYIYRIKLASSTQLQHFLAQEAGALALGALSSIMGL